MSAKNFYDDILAICKQLDKQEGKKFEAWQFKFKIASQVAVRSIKGSWRLEDEQGGIHDFEFRDEKTLHYINSTMEDREPPWILSPLSEKEIADIVTNLRDKLEDGEPYTPFPDEKRTIESPLPGFAWLKQK